MHGNHPKTAILYFTRTANGEAHAKTLSSAGFQQNKAIAGQLIQHTYRQLKKSGLPVEVFGPDKQQGATFGDRLAHAVENLFAKGYENVIAIGNDCIHLTSGRIRQAAELMKRNSIVAGPAEDGGVYLLGINCNAFKKIEFCRLSWKTGALLDDLDEYAREVSQDLVQLATLSDIDDEKGLWRLLRKSARSGYYFSLIQFLLSISISGRPTPSISFRQRYAFQADLSVSRRGPPVGLFLPSVN